MKSNWTEEIKAILWKEWVAERRNSGAALISLMLSVTTTFTLAFAFYGKEMTPSGAVGMLWAGILFAGVNTATKSFVAEEEAGTGDLLRMWANPYSVFWGKALYACIQCLVAATLVSVLFLFLANIAASNYLLLILSVLGGSFSLGCAVAFCSALIGRGSNRGAMAGVVALPIVIPLLAIGITAGRAAFLDLSLQSGLNACLEIWLYTLLLFAITPHLFAKIWRES